VRTKLSYIRISAIFAMVRHLITVSLTIYLIKTYLDGDNNLTHALLLIYWVMHLPQLGQFTSDLIRQYPGHKNLTLRLLEPLGTPNETSVRLDDHAPQQAPSTAAPVGIHLSLDKVSVSASGHHILKEISLEIKPGEQVAIVGPSGAGKSSFVGLLLGWYQAETGHVHVNGTTLDGDHLEWLRGRTAWVDPAVQIWNRSFLENLRYGQVNQDGISETLRQADLVALLEKMPEGLQTFLGEGGSLVSGGEGQRVRLGRAMLRTHADLVILDEPFRGLDRQTRHRLMNQARELWKGATLLCVTHDISETEDFGRVLVIDEGTLVEEGDPAELSKDPNSVYFRLLQSEREVMQEVWNNPSWRHLFLDRGQLTEKKVVAHD